MEVTALRFEKIKNSDSYLVSRQFINELGRITISFEKDKNGNYNIVSLGITDEETEYTPLKAGLAKIYRFINENINDTLKINRTNITRAEDQSIVTSEHVQTLSTQNIKMTFYKHYKDEKNKYIPFDCLNDEVLNVNVLKLYFFEKLLTDLCSDDIRKIGTGDIILNGVEVSLTTKRKTESSQPIQAFDLYGDIDYKLDFVKGDRIKVFFKSITENSKKQIAVLYNVGHDCSGTAQRIRKRTIQTDVENRGAEKIVSYCSDWEISTIGNNKIITDLANRAAYNLSIFLNVSEKFIRAQDFETLWRLCKSSS